MQTVTVDLESFLIESARIDAMERRIDELEDAIRPFVDAYEMFAKQEAFARLLSLDQLGRLAAGEVSGQNFKAAKEALTQSYRK